MVDLIHNKIKYEIVEGISCSECDFINNCKDRYLKKKISNILQYKFDIPMCYYIKKDKIYNVGFKKIREE